MTLRIKELRDRLRARRRDGASVEQGSLFAPGGAPVGTRDGRRPDAPPARPVDAAAGAAGPPEGGPAAPRWPPAALVALGPDAPLDPVIPYRLEALRATHPALHERLQRLDPHQLQAVLQTDPAALVRAQVGSGKTTVLTHRLLYLHFVEGVPLRDVAVLTFTNRAAGELRDRVQALCAPDVLPADAFWLMGTFHSVARALLARRLPLQSLGFTPEFTVIDEHERDELHERLIAEHGLSIKYRRQLGRRLDALRQGGDGLHGVMKRPDDLTRLVELAQQEQRRRNVMTFDDLIDRCTELLQAHPLDPAPRHILVDELQDCDARQLDLLAALAGTDSGLFAVGDPNQVIYSWRGGRADVFQLLRDRSGARVYGLPRNYRSTATILQGARALLDPSEAELAPVRARGRRIRVRRHHDALQEGLYLAAHLRQRQAAGLPLSTVAVLARTRRQLEPIAATLQRADIPCDRPRRTGVHAQPALRWVLRLLRAAAHPAELDAAYGALQDPDFGPLPRGLRLGRAYRRFRDAEDTTPGLSALLAFLARALPEGPRRTAALALGARLQSLATWLATGGPGPLAAPGLATRIWDTLHLTQGLHPTSAAHAAHVESVQRFLADLEASCAVDPEPLLVSLPQHLHTLTRGRPSSAATRDTVDPGVRLLTLHAAKGLEFDTVYITGANAGLLPLAGTWRDPAREAEERRLFFVGLTRARDDLEISYHSHPHAPRAEPAPSPYLLRLPPELVDWDEGPGGAVYAPPPRDQPPALREPEPCKGDPAAPWRPGQAVRHPRYGVGEVLAVEGGQVRCDFGRQGERSFSLAFCPLEGA